MLGFLFSDDIVTLSQLQIELDLELNLESARPQVLAQRQALPPQPAKDAVRILESPLIDYLT